jgi:hypothetical protein
MADKDKCTYEIAITGKQLDELEKASLAQDIPTSGQLIVEFIKDTIKNYRNNVLKRDADLDGIR